MRICCGEKGIAVRCNIKPLLVAFILLLSQASVNANPVDESTPLNASVRPEDRAWLEQVNAAAKDIQLQAPEVFKGRDFDVSKHLSKEDKQCFAQAAANATEITLKELEAHNPFEPKAQSRLMIFVSFSMPETSLKQWISQAHKTGATIAVRGLHENSLQKTMAKLYGLTGESNLGGMAIDPVSFQTFAINQVPSVVITDPVSPNEPQPSPEFDVVVGNAGLYAALSQLSTSKARGHYAKAKLDTLQGAL